jgi:hypothetical protein
MTLREQVDSNAARVTAEVKQMICEAIQNLPAWEQLVNAAQQGSRDSDLMARLSRC